jgi:hypothetical protein
MRLVRSWPLNPPEGHPQIIDDCERVYIETVDYTPLGDLGENFIHLDWDVAVNRDALRAFADKCEKEPNRIRVAPTMNWVTRQYRANQNASSADQWLVWKLTLEGKRNLEPGEPFCDMFAFGMVYFPIAIFQKYLAADTSAGNSHPDINFCEWRYNTYYGGIRKNPPGVPVEWDTHAVHLNYSMAAAFNDKYCFTCKAVLENLDIYSIRFIKGASAYFCSMDCKKVAKVKRNSHAI